MEFFDAPSVTHFLLKGLDPHRHYLFSVFARTAAGRGLPLQLEGATLLDGGVITPELHAFSVVPLSYTDWVIDWSIDC